MNGRGFGIASVWVALTSCGGQATAPTTPTEAPAAPKAASAPAVVKPTIDVKPAPTGLFLVARVSQSDALVSRIGEWCSLPFGINDGLSMLGEDLPNILRMDLPVELAMSLADEMPDPEFNYGEVPDWADGGMPEYTEPSDVHFIASVAVSKPEALIASLKDAGKSVEVKEDDQYVIELERELVCLLGPSAGPTPQRLACGSSRADVDVLAGYANTGLVTASLPDKAAYLELRIEPLRARYGDDVREMRSALPEFLREMNIGNDRFDGAMETAARATVDEILAWVDGVETWGFSLDFAKDHEILIGESTVRFRKSDSYVAEVLQRAAKEAAPAPQLFWDLPKDVDAASFATRLTPTESDRKIAANLSQMLAGALEHGGVASGVVDNWVTSLRGLVDGTGSVVVAMGSPPAEKHPKPKTANLLDGFGYYLVGVEGDHGGYAQLWRNTVTTFNDKRLRAQMGKQLEEDLSKLPFIKARKRPASKSAPLVEVYELGFSTPKSELSKTYKVDRVGLYVALATVGERTWFAFGFSEKSAVDPVLLLTAGGQYLKLAEREGLSALHERRMFQGSFITLNTYAKMFAGLPFGGDGTPLGPTFVHAMPHRGITPLIFEESASADGPSLTVRMEAPREVFEDGSALVVSIAAAFGAAARNSVD